MHPGQPVLDASEGKQTLRMHTGEYRQSGFAGFGSTFWTYSGARSAVRTGDRRPAVIMQSNTAPQEQVFFAKLEAERRDNDRSVKIGSLLKGGNPFSDKTSAKPDPDWTVPYDATEISAGLWRLVPKVDLPPGEYGIYLKQGFLYDFGVD